MSNSENLEEKSSSDSVQTPEKTLQDITASVEALRRKADEMRQARQRYVQAKVVDREALLKQAIDVHALSAKAQQFLETLSPSTQDPLLANDPEFQAQVENARTLVTSLAEQQEEINAKISAIEAQPDVLGRVWDEAKAENSKVDREVEAKKTLELMRGDTKAFMEKIRGQAERRNGWFLKRDELTKSEDALREPLKKNILEIREELRLKGDSKSAMEILEILTKIVDGLNYNGSSNKVEEAYRKLTKIQSSFGFFGNRAEKDSVAKLFSLDSDFGAYIKASQEYSRWQHDELTSVDAAEAALGKEWDELQEKYRTYGGIPYEITQPALDALPPLKVARFASIQETFRRAFEEARRLEDARKNPKNE